MKQKTKQKIVRLNSTARTLFAIRQKSTGFYLPDGESYSRTSVVPDESECRIPRLFEKEAHAKIALTCWLKGVASTERVRDWESGYEESGDVVYSAVKGRKRNDMEVVPVTLVLK